jgi:AraC-like DNA-binding protein
VDFDLWFVWAGRGEMTCNDQTFSLGPGSTFCLRPGFNYDATHDPRHRLGVCAIHFDFVDAHDRVIRPALPDLPPLAGHLANVALYERLLRHVAELFRTGQPDALVRAADYLRLVLRDLQTPPTLGPVGVEREHVDRINEVMRHVRENPGKIFTIAELAELAFYSVAHFTRVFTQVAGVGPKEFCIRERMERARLLLQDSAMTIQQVAAALGYADMFFFSRQFKQHFGVSPRRWRTSLPKVK